MERIEKLQKLGQSLWYDNIERRLLQNGDMAAMINAGEIRGVTSNPSIFNNAISKSSDYDDALQTMSWAGWKAEDMFFQLAIEDIQDTADLFARLFKNTDGKDGFVSLEVSPRLAYDAEGTYQQVLSLWKLVNRPNLMVKIPATKEGLVAIRKSIAAGLNINVTLIFSVERYREVIEAYLSGLEDRLAKGLSIERVNSVASFFVSRVDSKIDKKFDDLVSSGKITKENALEVKGKAAIANSKIAYQLFEEIFSSERAKKLMAAGGRLQRPLWASTSTKDPAYSDVMYVDKLIGANTVNTVPPQTLKAFRDHGNVALTIEKEVEQARKFLNDLPNYGIDLDVVTQELEDEGVTSFANAFSSLLDTIESKKDRFQASLLSMQKAVEKQVEKLDQSQVMKRMFAKDATLWTNDSSSQLEIQKRLGWLDAPFTISSKIPMLTSFREKVQAEGFRHMLLVGMGGSSLASEVIGLTFKEAVNGLNLAVLDSTAPEQVLAETDLVNREKTLFSIASKSGGTSEVQANLAYFYNKMQAKFGSKAGENFIAITDPGTSLTKQAHDMGFLKLFEADPNVGGRYSAMIMFGLVTATLLGVDLDRFSSKAVEFAKYCQPSIPAGRNPGLVLGAILGEANKAGRNKLTIIAEEPFRSFGSWLEQLVAESSGKLGLGIVPVDIEPFMTNGSYHSDRIFVYLRNDGTYQQQVDHIAQQNHPVITFNLNNVYQLGQEFYRWEIAIAIACSIIGVDAFDQPNVQDSKQRTAQKVKDFKEKGKFDIEKPAFEFSDSCIMLSSNLELKEVKSPKDALIKILETAEQNSFIAINAFVTRNEGNLKDLQELRLHILNETNCATTLGFGPRFLHSTGQLHKGGPDEGIFIMITDEIMPEVEIPGWGLGYQDLILAQALGDYEALKNRNRKVIWFRLKGATFSDLWK